MTRQFHKLLALYSASTLRSDSMLAIGLIQREVLMHYAQAVVALYANAVICEDNLKEHGQAIKLYQELINRFPRHELSTDAKRRSSALEQKSKQSRKNFANANFPFITGGRKTQA